MSRPYSTRYLANTNPYGDKEFHDLYSEKPGCQIDEIMGNHHDKPYAFKSQALADGYDPCNWCMPGESTR